MRLFTFASVILWGALAGSSAQAGDDPIAPTAPATAAPTPASDEGFVKRTIRSILDDSKDPDKRGFGWGPFEPRLEVISAGSGPAPVLHFWAPDMGGSGIDFHAAGAYSLYGYQYYTAQIGRVPYVGRRLPRTGKGTTDLFPLADLEKTASLPGFQIFASARYRDYTREDFYGVGPSSVPENRSDYRLKDQLYEGVIRGKVARLSLMGRAGLMKPSIHPGKDSNFPNTELSNDDFTAPGLTSTPDLTFLSAAAWLEMRDEPANAHKGASLGVAVSRFDDRHAAAFEFTRVVVDAREYIPLGSRMTLALRQIAFLDTPDEGSQVPFYMLPNFGGSTFLRGFSGTRFRDNKLLAGGAEYRIDVHKHVQFALIYEAGEVSPTMHDFHKDRIKQDYGAGIRLKTPKRVIGRLDVLRSSERTRIDLKLGPSF
jgi:hypothetical protein